MSEQLLLSGLQAKDELFETLTELVSKQNRIRVLLAIDEEKTNSEIAEESGVSVATVKRAKSELQELDLIERRGHGSYQKSLSVLDKPLMKHLIEERLEENG